MTTAAIPQTSCFLGRRRSAERQNWPAHPYFTRMSKPWLIKSSNWVIDLKSSMVYGTGEEANLSLVYRISRGNCENSLIRPTLPPVRRKPGTNSPSRILSKSGMHKRALTTRVSLLKLIISGRELISSVQYQYTSVSSKKAFPGHQPSPSWRYQPQDTANSHSPNPYNQEVQ